jgi:opacity protein-like surface antigen
MLLATIKHMLGPFRNGFGLGGQSWLFIGTDEAGRHHVWKLHFDFKTRSFVARTVQHNDAQRYAEQMATADLFKSDHVHPEFTVDLRKTTAQNLKALLTDEDVAGALGKALTYKG